MKRFLKTKHCSRILNNLGVEFKFYLRFKLFLYITENLLESVNTFDKLGMLGHVKARNKYNLISSVS